MLQKGTCVLVMLLLWTLAHPVIASTNGTVVPCTASSAALNSEQSSAISAQSSAPTSNGQATCSSDRRLEVLTPYSGLPNVLVEYCIDLCLSLPCPDLCNDKTNWHKISGEFVNITKNNIVVSLTPVQLCTNTPRCHVRDILYIQRTYVAVRLQDKNISIDHEYCANCLESTTPQGPTTAPTAKAEPVSGGVIAGGVLLPLLLLLVVVVGVVLCTKFRKKIMDCFRNCRSKAEPPEVVVERNVAADEDHFSRSMTAPNSEDPPEDETGPHIGGTPAPSRSKIPMRVTTRGLDSTVPASECYVVEQTSGLQTFADKAGREISNEPP